MYLKQNLTVDLYYYFWFSRPHHKKRRDYHVLVKRYIHFICILVLNFVKLQSCKHINAVQSFFSFKEFHDTTTRVKVLENRADESDANIVSLTNEMKGNLF